MSFITAIFFKRFIYLFRAREREREHEWAEQRERESQAYSALSMELDMGFDPSTLRSGPEPKPRAGRPADFATQAPL